MDEISYLGGRKCGVVGEGGVTVHTIFGDLAGFFSRDICEQGQHVEAHHDVTGFEGQISAKLNKPGGVGDVVVVFCLQGAGECL